MCRVLGVSPSGYYAWGSRGSCARARRDEELGEAIRAIHEDSRGTYGVPRVHAELSARGWRISRKRVARLMREAGLAGVSRRRGTRTTRTESSHRAAPDRVVGFLYLAIVLDVFSRRVVGWSMAHHLRTELVLGALNMAGAQRRPERVVHHSDRGAQYTSLAFGKRCREMGVIPSTGSAGDCFDNAMAESFFATLECELIDRRSFRTQAEARTAIFEFIEGWYNTRRRHSALGYLSPNDFEHAAPTPSASSLEGETLSSFSVPKASAAMPQNADSRGGGPHKDIIQESITGLPLPLPPAKIALYSPTGESPYVSTESG